MSRAAQIYTDWDKIKRELEERERAVFCGENLNGYKLAVTNKVLTVVYSRCMQEYGVQPPAGHSQRLIWEKNMWVIIKEAYSLMYKYELVEPIKNTWQVSQLEECVRCLSPEKICNILRSVGNPFVNFDEEVIKNRMGKNRAAQRTAQRK